jgi:hypothetical protein
MRHLCIIISSTSGGLSVGIVRLWTKGHGVCCFVYFVLDLKDNATKG